MFRLHERTRRRINLAIFVLVCLLPTAALSGWAAWRHTASHTRAELRRLERLLGLRADADRVRHPRPGVIRYEKLELVDPPTGKVVLRCRYAEAAWREHAGTDGRSTLSLAVTLAGPEARLECRRQFERLIHQVLARRYGFDRMQVRISAPTVALVGASPGHRFEGIRMQLAASPETSEAELTFHLSPPAQSDPVRVRLGREGSSVDEGTVWELSTGGKPLPCSLLTPWFAGLRRLGPACTFSGRLQVAERGGVRQGACRGQLADVDLAGLAGGCTAHRITGRAWIDVEESRWVAGRIERLVASVRGGPGHVSRSLVDAAARYMGLIRGSDPGGGDAMEYDQLAAWICLDRRGIRVQGRCVSPASGVVLTGPAGPLLGDCGGQALPVASVVQTLLPPESPLVGATRQTVELMRWLPVPEESPMGLAEKEPRLRR